MFFHSFFLLCSFYSHFSGNILFLFYPVGRLSLFFSKNLLIEFSFVILESHIFLVLIVLSWYFLFSFFRQYFFVYFSSMISIVFFRFSSFHRVLLVYLPSLSSSACARSFLFVLLASFLIQL